MKKAISLIFIFLFASPAFGAMTKQQMAAYSKKTMDNCICIFIEAGSRSRCKPSVDHRVFGCRKYCISKLSYARTYGFDNDSVCLEPFSVWSSKRNWDDLP